MGYMHKETIAAISTAPGAGGVALLRMSGDAAVDVARKCFAPFSKSLEIKQRHAYFGLWNDERGNPLDEIVLTFFKGPRSYTGEDVVEIACHGSIYIQQKVLATCLSMGARLAQAGEFTQRAFLNGRMDLTQAEGVADLIASESQASHQLALHQMKGGIKDAMQEFRTTLIDFAALIELENDFAEEDVAFADRDALRKQVSALCTEIDRLLESFNLGQAIRDGVEVVLAGRPNAGKSTLLNGLVEEDRAIVSSIAGTTRDTIDAELIINGVKFRIIDTAGIRDTSDEIEALGVERTLSALQKAALIIYVFDITQLNAKDALNDIESLDAGDKKVIALANKVDLLADPPSLSAEPIEFLPLSAQRTLDIQTLKSRIFDIGIGELPPQGSVILTQARHVEALSSAREALERVDECLSAGLSGDLVALDLRQAMHYIGEVTGQISTDDLLGSIFGRFCIGK